MKSPETETNLSPERQRARLAELLKQKAGQTDFTCALSHGQRALWFLHQLAPDSAAYHLMYAWRIHSTLDVVSLKNTFQILVDRHASLRTSYIARDGKLLQRVQARRKVDFEIIDASDASDAELKRRVSETAHRPFDLERDSPMRASLFKRSSDDHVLLVVFHHIAIDFPSLVMLLDELLALYPSVKAGDHPPLAPLKTQYADYVRWQNEMLAGAEETRLRTFWEQRLAGELPVLNLPIDRPRPPVQTYCGATHHFNVDEHLTARLRALAKAEGVTLYVVLLAAFQVLLHRYTGQDDIVVGAPAGSRSRAEFASVVGYFVNPVMMRADLAGNPAFREFLCRVRQTVLTALEHQDYPFMLLVEQLQPARDPARSPLCDVMFIMQRPMRRPSANGAEQSTSLLEVLLLGREGIRMKLGELELEPFKLEEQISQLDLTLLLVDTGDSIFASLPYNTDLFDARTIERFAAHYRELLESIVADPSAQISDLRFMSEAERHLVLEVWGRTEEAEPTSDACIHELFEAQVGRTPDAFAVVYEGESLTYKELNSRANRLAHYLRARGVAADVPVGIYVERSLDMVVAVLGVLKAGGAYVPLDPMYPQERLAQMMTDARAAVLLTQGRLAGNLTHDALTHDAHVVRLDAEDEVFARYGDENPVARATNKNLAYVIYTSGSTGKPKGVMIEHGAAVNLAFAHRQAIYKHRAGETLRVSLNAPLAFDGCVERLMLMLFGHTIYILPEEVRHDPHAMLAYVERHALDVLDYTPSQLKLLIEAGLSASHAPAARLVLVGGEPIDESLWRVLVAQTSHDFFNVYGPTECTVNAAVCRIRNAPLKPTIGRPLANVEIYILDDARQPVASGIAGEIYVGGAGLARGYINDSALTAQKFVPHHLAWEGGARLYRTGDVARFLPDGNIEFLGRTDHQLKIRGFRIELGEIEAALLAHAVVKEALVAAVEERAGDKRLTAYVVAAAPEAAPSITDIKSFLKERLPAYMIPSSFIVLDALPLNTNGKIDRKALPAPDATETDETYLAPETETEKSIAAVWMEILHRERVGANDNFFDLGGHSLAATQLILKLREAFALELPLRTIFEAPTVSSLAARIVGLQLDRTDDARLEEMLAALEGLSEDEARRLLNS